MSGESYGRGPVISRVHANGEIVDVVDDTPRRRLTTRAEGVRYVLIEIDAVSDILSRLSPLQTRIVGMILADYRDGEPWAKMTVSDLARELDVPLQNVYRALKPLIAANIVTRPTKTLWQVNPHLGWRGSRKMWESVLKNTPRPDLEALRG